MHSIFSLLDAGGLSPSEGDKRLMAMLSEDLDGMDLEAFQALLDGALEKLRLADGEPVLPQGGKDLPPAAALEGLAEALESDADAEEAMAALIRLMQLEAAGDKKAQAEMAPSGVQERSALLDGLRPPKQQGPVDVRTTEMRALMTSHSSGASGASGALGTTGNGLDMGGRDMLADMDWLKSRVQERLSTLLSNQQQTQERGGGEPLIREVGSGGHQAQAASPQQLAALMSTASQSGESSSMNRLPPIQMPVGGQNWGDALGQRIMMMKGQGIDRAEIKLNPPNLGPLEIRVAVTQEQTSLVLSSQHALTRDALEQALPRLRDMLQDKGLEMGDAEVNDGREEPSAEQDKEGRRGAEGNGRRDADAAVRGETNPAEAVRVSLLDEYV